MDVDIAMGEVTGLVDRIRDAAANVDFGPQHVRAILADVLADPDDWLDRRYRRREADRDWMLYPLYRAADGRCSMLVAVFKPGVRAPVHNHGS
jgi:predicted metal-dependent enzyme (double-stranded beta helix superfamily)